MGVAAAGKPRPISPDGLVTTQSLFEKSLEPRGIGFGVPRLRGPLVERRTNRVNAELQTRFFNPAHGRGRKNPFPLLEEFPPDGPLWLTPEESLSGCDEYDED